MLVLFVQFNICWRKILALIFYTEPTEYITESPEKKSLGADPF